MPDVEQTGRLNDGKMFLHRSGGIPERHIPAAEIDEVGAERLMRRMEGRLMQHDVLSRKFG